MNQTIELKTVFRFKYISEVVEYAEKNDLNYKMTKNGRFVTLDLSFATFDAKESNLVIIATLPKKLYGKNHCLVA